MKCRGNSSLRMMQRRKPLMQYLCERTRVLSHLFSGGEAERRNRRAHAFWLAEQNRLQPVKLHLVK